MAETEVLIRYRTTPAALIAWPALAVSLIGLFFCFWAVIASIIGLEAGKVTGEVFLAIMVSALTIEIIAVLLWIVASDDSLLLSRDGLSCSFLTCPGPALRVERPWEELAAVLVAGGRRQALVLVYKHGPPVRISLGRLSRYSLEQLVLAVQVWAPHVETGDIAGELRALGCLSAAASAGVSFTQMWESELIRRFGSTSFVPLEPGHLVAGRYRVARQLAFGGLSAIYLVADGAFEEFVLKEAVLPADCEPDLRGKALELFEREMRILAALRHDGVARVLDGFVEDGRHYMLLEYVPGRDLRSLTREDGPQAAGRVLDWALAVAEILSYLHERQPPVIHRDVSPDNLILEEDGQIKLIDFGAANEFLGTATGTMIGKQAYIPAEQLRGKAVPQSDLYALGATMHFLLTGRDPEPLSVSRPAALREGIGSDLDHIVAQLTAGAAADRPPSARALVGVLRGMGAA